VQGKKTLHDSPFDLTVIVVDASEQRIERAPKKQAAFTHLRTKTAKPRPRFVPRHHRNRRKRFGLRLNLIAAIANLHQ
jgi:hypothetical protein